MIFIGVLIDKELSRSICVLSGGNQLDRKLRFLFVFEAYTIC